MDNVVIISRAYCVIVLLKDTNIPIWWTGITYGANDNLQCLTIAILTIHGHSTIYQNDVNPCCISGLNAGKKTFALVVPFPDHLFLNLHFPVGTGYVTVRL